MSLPKTKAVPLVGVSSPVEVKIVRCYCFKFAVVYLAVQSFQDNNSANSLKIPKKHSIPDNIDKVVVFPAPFVPKNPKHSPAWTEKVKDCTATFGP